MGVETGIQWTDSTWNVVRGCSKVSAGCKNCYAEREANRHGGPGRPYEGLVKDGRWTGEVRLIEKHLLDPLRWQKPRRVFVNSMSDLFHEEVADETIDRIFAVMALAPRHQFQVLTKRAERMQAYLSTPKRQATVLGCAWEMLGNTKYRLTKYRHENVVSRPWPLPNAWMGVSAADQETLESRLDHLHRTPAAVRFLSLEPLVGAIDLEGAGAIERDSVGGNTPGEGESFTRGLLDWVIVGGESGPGARPCDVVWVERIVADCGTAGVPCFVKQLGGNATDARLRDVWGPTGKHHYTRPFGDPLLDEAMECDGYTVTDHKLSRLIAAKKGDSPEQWPEHLRVQEWPA
jgi:protein gp37